MKKIFSILIVALILSGCASAPAPEPKTPDQLHTEQLLSTALDLNKAENWLAAENTWKQLAMQYQLFDQRENQAIALHNQAFAMTQQGKYQQALEPLERALEIDSDTTNSGFYQHTLLHSQIQKKLGQKQKVEEIEQLIIQAENVGIATKDMHTYILLLNHLASVQMSAEQYEQAEDCLQKALNLTQDKILQLTLNINMAKVLEKQGKDEQVLQLWFQNLNDAKTVVHKVFIAESLAGIGRTYLIQGQADIAKDYLSRASQNFQILKQTEQSEQTEKLLKSI